MNIKRIRKELGMTQQEFADLLGVCRQSIGKWELGEVLPSKMAFKTIQLACEKRGIKIDDKERRVYYTH